MNQDSSLTLGWEIFFCFWEFRLLRKISRKTARQWFCFAAATKKHQDQFGDQKFKLRSCFDLHELPGHGVQRFSVVLLGEFRARCFGAPLSLGTHYLQGFIVQDFFHQQYFCQKVQLFVVQHRVCFQLWWPELLRLTDKRKKQNLERIILSICKHFTGFNDFFFLGVFFPNRNGPTVRELWTERSLFGTQITIFP